MAAQPVDPDREYRLIEQLEFRIAGANTEEKFEAILQKFLAALLQKLASETTRNRNLAIKVCQYISQRLKIDGSISLPVQPLLKTFREANNTFVKRFALVFIEQGLARLTTEEATIILQDVLRSSIQQQDVADSSDTKMWSIAFDFLLSVLQQWRIPDHATKENLGLKDAFGLSHQQCVVLSSELSKFLMYDPKTVLPDLHVSEDFRPVFDKHFKTRPKTVLQIAKFLFSSVFEDEHRLIPATILSVDANASASSLADAMFKQCSFDLEAEPGVDALFSLFDLAKPKLQTRILTLLNRSQTSTEHTSRIVRIVEKELFNDATGLESSKLRAAVFTYLTWAVRISKSLGSVRGRLQGALRDFIEQQGWPTSHSTSSADLDLRAKAYESIGLMAAVEAPDGTTTPRSSNLDLITWLFTSLRCDVGRDIRGSIDEALSRILNVTRLGGGDEQKTFKDLLLWNLTAQEGDEDPLYFQPTRNSTRYIAVRFVNKCLPFSDVDARYFDLVALGFDDRREVAEEAGRGLDPYWHASNRVAGQAEQAQKDLLFPAFQEFVARCLSDHVTRMAVHRHPASLSAVVLFARNLLVTEALAGSAYDVRGENEWQIKVEAMMDGDALVRQKLRMFVRMCDKNAVLALLNTAILGLSKGIVSCANIAVELAGTVSDAIIAEVDEQTLQLCQVGLLNTSVQLQSARTYGIVVSLTGNSADIVSETIKQCADWESAIGNDAVKVRGLVLKATYIVTRLSLRRSLSLTGSMTEQFVKLLTSIALKSRDKEMVGAAYIAIGQISLCLPDSHSLFTERDELMNHMFAQAKKENEGAVTALGRLLNAVFAHVDREGVDKIAERFFALHEVRKAEFHFAVGEALSVAAIGFQSSSTITEFDVDAEVPEWGVHADLYRSILDRSVDDARNTKPSLRKAAAIWLLSLVQFSTDSAYLKTRLRECQAAFAGLLTDRDEVVQEAGSRGLGLVYEKGDSNLRDDLVRDLVQSFTGGGTKLSGIVNEDTQLFEAGALPTESGQSITTYKDIVSLATEMGDPSLVYRFMNLASNNAIWTSRAAFGRFGLSGVLADSTYLTENQKFYPKLFRYRFDPNPNVQRSMDDIWKALVKEPTRVIEENFDLIMEDLLKSIVSGKEWRAREASCGAIADLIQGREVEKFEKYLNDIWKVAFKVLDDVKETVRIAAMKLCRTLTSMLIRNLEVGHGTTIRAAVMLNHAVPFLLQQMDGGAAQEVQQYAVVTLLEVVKKSPPRSLRSFAPQILETLVMSLSSLEHESINYLHLNADKYGLTAEKLDKMRVSSINTSPLTDAIERCLESLTATANTDIQETTEGPSPVDDAMDRLGKAFKRAIGLPSKVGLSKVMITLVVRHHVMFRPYADQFVQLTRKYILDRNATISVSFSMALAYLMRLASNKEVEATNKYAQKLYFESQELSHRAVAGEIVQAISKASNDVFMRFASVYLPFAFIGRNDLDEEVRARFDPPWKDNVGGSRSLNLYLTEIVGLIDIHIKSSLWPIRQACCLAVADLVSSMDATTDYSQAEAQLLWVVVQQALDGKTWDGKEKVLAAYPKFVRKARSIWTQYDTQLQAIAKREAKRANVVYRRHAIAALGEFAAVRPDLELAGMTFDLLTNIAEELDDGADAMEIDGEEKSRSSTVDATWAAMMQCSFNVLSDKTNPSALNLALELVRKAHSKHITMIDTEIYDGATRFITRVALGSSSSHAAVRQSVSHGAEDGQEVKEAAATRGTSVTRSEHELAAFSCNLAWALVTDDAARHGTENEKIRKSRVELARVTAESAWLSAPTCAAMLPVLTEWSRSERVKPLRLELEKIAETLSGRGVHHSS